jgi:saccharopine dehydrogenase-like NADP-dependent oxidoreductase
MKIAILGCGATGSVIARLLEKEKFVDDIVCLDRNPKRSRKFLGRGGFDIRKADASNQNELRRQVKDYDWIINALPTASYVKGKPVLWNPKIIEVALKAGINYMDLACFGGNSTIAEQLRYKKKFEDEKLLALINSGSSPGLTNLLVRENADDVEVVERVSIRTLEEQKGSEFIVPWSKEEMLDMVWKTLVYSNKKFKFKEPFSGTSAYDFPPPFGKMYCYLISNDETYTIPHFVQMKSLDVKNAGSDIEILRTLYRLRMFEDEPVYFRKTKIIPYHFVYSIIPEVPTGREMMKIMKEGYLEDGFFGIFVDNLGKVMKKRVLVRSYTIFPSQKIIKNILPGSTYITYPTAVCALSFIKSMYKRKVYGVLPPEALNKAARKNVLSELERKKIIISSEYKTLT